MLGLLLFFVAIFLFLPLQFINFFVVLWVFREKRSFINTIDSFFLETAIDIDRYGNRNFRTLWNNTLIKEDGIKFGDERETISSVLGKNELKGSLKKLGLILVWILDKLDKDHCKNSIRYFY